MRLRGVAAALTPFLACGSLAATAASAATPPPKQITFLSHGVVSSHNTVSKPHGKPKGWVVIIHGGGWQLVGRKVMASENSTVRYVTSLGWAADNIDYRKAEHSLPDVLATYDALRHRVGAATPICLLGHSAGGNLALLAGSCDRPSRA